MSTDLFLVLANVPTLAIAPPQAAPPTAVVRQSEDFDARLAGAGEDVDKLWSLYLWCEAGEWIKEGRIVLRKIIGIVPNHRQANEALGHVEYRGRWFTTKKALEEFKRAEEEREARERGLVRYKERFVPAEDVPYLERGLERGPDGRWVTPEELALLEKGWTRQDLEWVSPDEAHNVEQGMWKCGAEWLDLPDANAYHAKLGAWWRIPGHRYQLYATCDRDVALEALDMIERTYVDLVRIYGQAPGKQPIVILLRNVEQYVRFARGDEQQGLLPSQGTRSFTVHHAFLADQLFDAESKQFLGAAVAYWDAATEVGQRFGRHSARHASGLAFGEAVDPSPKTIAKAERNPKRGNDLQAFYGEKQLPAWFRAGAATYVERYFIDALTEVEGNPFWAREWSLTNLRAQGGLRPLAEFFAYQPDPDDDKNSERWINESGLLMAFVLDGGNAAVNEAHASLKEALRKRKDIERAALELQDAILANEVGLRGFAGH